MTSWIQSNSHQQMLHGYCQRISRLISDNMIFALISTEYNEGTAILLYSENCYCKVLQQSMINDHPANYFNIKILDLNINICTVELGISGC